MLVHDDCAKDPGARPGGYVYTGTAFEGAPDARVIVLSHDPGDSTLTYLVALHEIGHLQQDCSEEQVDEAAAWRWAIEQSREPITADDWAEILWRLRTYANEPFERLLAEAERKAA
jgi:hypothetical protein